MSKSSKIYVCNNCSYESAKWLGQCPSCKDWNTFDETDPIISFSSMTSSKLTIKKLKDVSDNEAKLRHSTGFSEFDRVLGGGMVPSGVILISGEPGIGKSTLLMQVISYMKNALYVSAEESIQQVALRGKRLKLGSMDDLQILSGYEVNGIIEKIKEVKPSIVVVDSIQTVYADEVRGLPGGVAQIKAVSSKLIKFAKEAGIILFLVGQVTKEGSVAGPKLLEHLVDVVLELQGDQKLDFRILRCLKNRFGPTNEIGIFEMVESGLQEVTNPSIYFLDKEKGVERVGVCPAVIQEGIRLMLVEMQSLTSRTLFALPKRVAEGFSRTKLEVLTAVLAKFTKYNLQDQDVYINIAGGLRSADSMLDLPIVLAIISSYANKPLPHDLVAFGEVSLTGQIRISKRAEQMEKECKRLGYTSFHKKFPNIKHVSQLYLFFKELK